MPIYYVCGGEHVSIAQGYVGGHGQLNWRYECPYPIYKYSNLPQNTTHEPRCGLKQNAVAKMFRMRFLCGTS